jgi:hypothetical protein
MHERSSRSRNRSKKGGDREQGLGVTPGNRPQAMNWRGEWSPWFENEAEAYTSACYTWGE